MAGTGGYQSTWNSIIDQTIDIDGTDIKLILCKSTTAYNPDHDDIADVTELTDASYARKVNGTDFTLQRTVDDTNNEVDIGFAADVTWSALAGGETITHVILVKDSGVDSTSPLIFCWNTNDVTTNGSDVVFDTATSASGGNFKLVMTET